METFGRIWPLGSPNCKSLSSIDNFLVPSFVRTRFHPSTASQRRLGRLNGQCPSHQAQVRYFEAWTWNSLLILLFRYTGFILSDPNSVKLDFENLNHFIAFVIWPIGIAKRLLFQMFFPTNNMPEGIHPRYFIWSYERTYQFHILGLLLPFPRRLACCSGSEPQLGGSIDDAGFRRLGRKYCRNPLHLEVIWGLMTQ